MPERDDLCRELVAIGTEHDLPVYRVTGLPNQAGAAAGAHDPATMPRAAAAALGLARAAIRVNNGTLGEHLEEVRAFHEAFGPVASDLLVLALHANGLIDETRRIRTSDPIRPAEARSRTTIWPLPAAPPSVTQNSHQSR
ncbi:hypothetical protein [Nonomuraea sp. NPDC049607]|uniref:hypothetical protein n=1 Tax=Nonomuraea sp. NPDC049607 TaxID=3154732 RepID=UPI0034371494